MEGYVYIIENKINRKIYVGQTIDPDRREKQHFGNTDYGCSCLRNAIGKYGSDNFEFIIIEKCFSEEELNKREMYWIRELNTIRPHGYNLTEGGTGGGRVFSEEHRYKLSETKRGARNPNFGKPDVINNIRWMRENGPAPWQGRAHSTETKKKIANSLRNKTIHCKRGHLRTPENTVTVKGTGARLCKECHNLRSRKFYAKSGRKKNG